MKVGQQSPEAEANLGKWFMLAISIEPRSEREKLVLAALPELSLAIIEFAREHGRITISEAVKLTGANRNTLKQHFRSLVESGKLNQHGKGRGVWYGLR